MNSPQATRMALGLITLCCAIPVGAAESAGDEIRRIFTYSDNALDDARSAPKDAQDRVNVALSQLESAITKYPEDAQLHLMMGRALIVHDCTLGGNNCSVRAKGYLTRAIGLDPKLVRAHVLLAHDALNFGCQPCATPHVAAAQKLDSRDPYVLEIRARQAQAAGMADQAEKLYLEAIDAFPSPQKRWQAYKYLSDIYRNRQDFQRTEWALQKALEAAPDGAWSNGNLGTFYIFAMGEYDKAIPVLRKTLSIMSYGIARQALALALYERWANAYMTKAGPDIVTAYWKEAQAESSDALSMFLISASYSGTGRSTRALLAAGQVPNTALEQVWQQGRTPLLMASFNNNTELAVFLVEQGANTNARDQLGIFAPHAAGLYANFRILEAMARKDANLQVLTTKVRETVLMLVARAGKSRPERLKAAALLIDKGVPLEAVSAHGSTALTYAIGARDIEMVKYLISRGARTDVVPPPPGRSPAVFAINVGDAEIVQEVTKNMDVNAKDHNGMSLVELAEKIGRPDVVKVLRSRK